MIEGFASASKLSGVENRLLCLSLDCPGMGEIGIRIVQNISAGQIGMVAIDPRSGIDQNGVTRLKNLLAVSAMG